MMKSLLSAVPLVTILLLVELASAKPVDHSKNPNFNDVTTKPVSGLPDHGGDSTALSYAGFDMPDFTDTDTPVDKKIIEILEPDEYSRLTTLKPSFEKPSRLPVTFKPGSEEPGSLQDITSKPGSWTTSRSVTPVEPVSGGTSSLVMSSEPSFGEPDSLATTLEPGSLSTTRFDVGSVKPSSLQTTLKPMGPDNSGNKLNNLPVKSARSNGISDIRSSCMMVSMGIFLIARSHDT